MSDNEPTSQLNKDIPLTAAQTHAQGVIERLSDSEGIPGDFKDALKKIEPDKILTSGPEDRPDWNIAHGLVITRPVDNDLRRDSYYMTIHPGGVFIACVQSTVSFNKADAIKWLEIGKDGSVSEGQVPEGETLPGILTETVGKPLTSEYINVTLDALGGPYIPFLSALDDAKMHAPEDNAWVRGLIESFNTTEELRPIFPGHPHYEEYNSEDSTVWIVCAGPGGVTAIGRKAEIGGVGNFTGAISYNPEKPREVTFIRPGEKDDETEVVNF
ncbi:hypothetical protein IPM62_03935 [Candidatus Woesebacteria bacterium]|nr:MAG: hypothetical protein IPM62_03935 [Candidatus Woesebacteria bacterium]